VISLVVCGIVFFNPITHEVRRACVPVAMVGHHRHLTGDRRRQET
jgi:hypothetical protein